MGNALPPPPKLTEDEERSVLDYDVTVQAIIDQIIAGKVKSIVMMVGAGISVSAGIPDFRSPGTGLYDNLQKYNLPSPQSMFEINYFRENPRPFCELAKEMYPGNFRPTPTHWFIRLLQEKGLLRRCYTQNIDTLEREAGIREELLVEAHGSFAAAACIECGAPYSQAWVRERIYRDEVPRCVKPGCAAAEGEDRGEGEGEGEAAAAAAAAAGARPGGLVKPNIVFFGEGLPRRFFQLKETDLPAADLVIVAGTSLAVQPFANVMNECGPLCPRLLLNREPVGRREAPNGHGFRFDCYDNYRDVAFLSDCDRAVAVLCRRLGWEPEFRALVESEGRGIALPRLPAALGAPAAGGETAVAAPASRAAAPAGGAAAPAGEEGAAEELAAALRRDWRTPAPPAPDVEAIIEEGRPRSGTDEMDTSSTTTVRNQCILEYPNSLEEISGFMKVRLKIILEPSLMDHTSTNDWVALLPVGARLPTEYADFAWVDFDNDESEEEEGGADTTDTEGGALTPPRRRPPAAQAPYTEAQLVVPPCGEGPPEPGAPAGASAPATVYEIWYVGPQDTVLARWGPFHVHRDMTPDERGLKERNPPLAELEALLKGVRSTLDASNEQQERVNKLIKDIQEEDAGGV